jgi:hypothetical protein
VGGMIGCAGMIAAVALILGIIASLFSTEAPFPERLTIAIGPAGMAFVAALLLLTRDRARHVSAVKAVRQMLLAREDVSEAKFMAHFPDADPTLIAQTRQAVSKFFDVPAQKIHPTDDLRSNLQFDALEPGFHSFVVYQVLADRNVAPQPFWFKSGGLRDIGDLAKEIQRVLDGFTDGEANTDDLQSS